ncbi:MAG TPA: hypothetical protein PKK48_04615 [Phycisphaerae bacterium]|nr:hypothetical protein [Phycisphaerae bacterium]HPS52249.1 hypothetical protein [Phycisphaerae bacterium]
MKIIIILIACSVVIIAPVRAEYQSFTYGGHTYRLYFGKDMRTWDDARKFAASTSIGIARGYLSNVNSAAENAAIYSVIHKVFDKAGYLGGIGSAARDGGGACYAWLGGNDMASEGEFYWASSTKISAQKFWTGGHAGHAVDSMYVNWGAGKLGHEPDNYNSSQNAVAIAAEKWPLRGGIGCGGQWNDINQNNVISFVVEYDTQTPAGKPTEKMPPKN